jgi:hypothetical protein
VENESFDKLSDSYAKYYSLTDHLVVDEIILLCKGRVIVKQYIAKKHKQSGIKLYKLCDSKLCTYSLYMDNFFSSPSDNLHIKTTNCWTVRPNRKGMLKNFGHEINLKRGDKD